MIRIPRPWAALLTLVACDPTAERESVRSTDVVSLADRPVAIVRTTSLRWEGEQTYIPLFADGSASGLVVVNMAGGRLYGTAVPDAWSWRGRDTVEICTRPTILRNEVGFPPMERDCAPHPITGKELDVDEDGASDLIETFTIVDSLFFRHRPPE